MSTSPISSTSSTSSMSFSQSSSMDFVDPQRISMGNTILAPINTAEIDPFLALAESRAEQTDRDIAAYNAERNYDDEVDPFSALGEKPQIPLTESDVARTRRDISNDFQAYDPQVFDAQLQRMKERMKQMSAEMSAETQRAYTEISAKMQRMHNQMIVEIQRRHTEEINEIQTTNAEI